MPPSLLATALLLQTYDKVSDAEAKARAEFDIRWKVALGIEIEDRPFAKSTLQLFRAQLILHEKVRGEHEGVCTPATGHSTSTQVHLPVSIVSLSSDHGPDLRRR